MKLDMNKAYDRVEWEFVHVIMKKLVFNGMFMEAILWCIFSVTYSVLINGALRKTIVPTGRLRQGDPLSLFLFVIITEVLSGMLSMAKESKGISGLKICINGPNVTHLFVDDDSMLFEKAR